LNHRDGLIHTETSHEITRKELLQLDHFISRDPTGVVRQVVVALVVWGTAAIDGGPVQSRTIKLTLLALTQSQELCDLLTLQLELEVAHQERLATLDQLAEAALDYLEK
jgi:hypothetical protein